MEFGYLSLFTKHFKLGGNFSQIFNFHPLFQYFLYISLFFILYFTFSDDSQNELLNLQRFCIIDNSDENFVTESRETFIIDECSILRHQILSDSYFVRQKRYEYIKQPEDCLLFSKFPPPQGPEEGFDGNFSSDSDLEYFLQDDIPGLRDSGWVSQARKAFRTSNGTMKVILRISYS